MCREGVSQKELSLGGTAGGAQVLPFQKCVEDMLQRCVLLSYHIHVTIAVIIHLCG